VGDGAEPEVFVWELDPAEVHSPGAPNERGGILKRIGSFVSALGRVSSVEGAKAVYLILGDREPVADVGGGVWLR
jgi:hypothetical protein